MRKENYFVLRKENGKRKISEPAALSVCRVLPDEEPKFVVQIIHGVSERKERYFPLLKTVAACGGAAVIHDLRGHGNTAASADDLGYFGDFGSDYETLFDDMDLVFASLCHSLPAEPDFDGSGDPLPALLTLDDPADRDTDLDFPDLPRFLLGFSMGSLIAGLYAAHRPGSLGGLILSGLPHHEPFVSPALLGLKLLGLFADERSRPKLLNSFAFSRYNKGFVPEPESDGKFLWLSNDLSNRLAFEYDPVCNHPNTLNAYENLFRLARDFYRPSSWELPRPDLPILISAGELDPVAGGDREMLYAKKFLRDLGFRRVKLTMFRGMRHEIYHDTGRETAFRTALTFIARHLEEENERLDKIRREYESIFTPKSEKSPAPSDSAPQNHADAPANEKASAGDGHSDGAEP